MIEDNRVWVGSMDALLAGAGDHDVRAGVMTLLATIDAVKVSTEVRRSSIRNTDFPGGYAENLDVDAQTGVSAEVRRGRAGQGARRRRRLRDQARDRR